MSPLPLTILISSEQGKIPFVLKRNVTWIIFLALTSQVNYHEYDFELLHCRCTGNQVKII